MESGETFENNTELCQLAYRYGTDKCPQIAHTYTPFYFELLKDKRQSTKKVLEIGLGHNECMQHVVKLKGSYFIGASLYMWRDFFPNAQIYGADNQPEILFEGERIKTYPCDQSKKEDLIKLIKKTGSDIDLFIDDGSHRLEDQIFTCLTLMPLLKKDVIYIIEDVIHSRKLIRALNQYECQVPAIAKKGRNNQLVVVRNKVATTFTTKKQWSTHMTMLVKTVSLTNKDVLEVGSGIFSTPLLHWLCKDKNKLYTYANDSFYYRFARQFQGRHHRIRFLNSWDDLKVDRHWGVVFFDHQPDERRGQDAIKFKDHADYIVIHDSGWPELFGYTDIDDHFKYRHDWKECRPWTTVLSNFKDLSELAIRLNHESIK
jgi:hypothetical protein